MMTERKNWRDLLTDCAGLVFAALWPGSAVRLRRSGVFLTPDTSSTTLA
ncbi:hypothetical protein [Gluconobacter oxydans]|nr:hypothetical protein [Gluconobacter oxydans]